MATFKKVAIIGAAGNVGQHILKAILDAGFDVTVISRAESTSVFEGVPEKNVVKGEYTPEFLRKALSGQDALVMAVSSGALASQKDIIDAAAEVGVKRIIPSEFGGDTSNPASLKAIPFNEQKKVVSDHLEKVVASNPQTTWTGVVTGPFFDWCLNVSFLGVDLHTHRATLYDEGKTRFDATNIDTVGKAVAKILSMPEKFQNERVLISGLAVNQVEILDAFKKADPSQEWAVSYKTADALREEGYAKVAKNDFSGIIEVIGASLFQAGHGSYYSENGKTANEVLGVKDDLYETVEKYVKSQSTKK